MKIATWNVNSLNVRLPRLLAWLTAHQPDAVCLQELKCETSKFPHEALSAIGYSAQVLGQKTYNGVAIVYKSTAAVGAVVQNIPDYDDPQARVIAATVDGVRLIGAYMVNGQALDSEKFVYKQEWLLKLSEFLATEVAAHPKLALLGDFNIAPEDADVHNPAAWAGQVLCTDIERGFFQRWLGLGLYDAFRLFPQEPNKFSWWDYRMLAFQKNQGLRIDHILVSEALKATALNCHIDRNERKGEKPSDHAPVVFEFE